MNYPQGFTEQMTPLPDSMGNSARTAIYNLAERGFVVYAGLTREHASAIGTAAQQDSIVEYCPKDAPESRFATIPSTERWLAKGDDQLRAYGRGMFVLLKQVSPGEHELAGYGWTGPEQSRYITEDTITFAIRVRKEYQSQGLSKPFASLILAGSAALYGASHIWLETWGSNEKAVKGYKKIGFKEHPEIARPDHRPSKIHGREVLDIRRYMSFPNELLAA